MARVLTILILFLSSVFMPWWVVTALVIISVAYFHAVASVIIAGVIFDTLFVAPVFSVYGFGYLFTLLFLILVIVGTFIRKSVLD